jgi:transposase
MPAPHAVPITVSEADRLTLQSWARRPKTAQALALRARIVLAAAAGEETNLEIAERLQTNRHTVAKWRGRYARRGLAGLTDEPRPAPRARSPTTAWTRCWRRRWSRRRRSGRTGAPANSPSGSG